MAEPITSPALNIYERLRFPFPTNSVKWRVGSRTPDKTRGVALAYVDARDVMERLDQVVGNRNWETRYNDAAGICICTLAVRIGDEWVVKSDGAGQTNVEGEKGAASTAFKRAAVQHGPGRYLYSLPDLWLDLTNEGRNFANTELLVLPEWATPAGWKKLVLKIEPDDRPLADRELGEMDEAVENYCRSKGQEAVYGVLNQMGANAKTVWTIKLMKHFIESVSKLPNLS